MATIDFSSRSSGFRFGFIRLIAIVCLGVALGACGGGSDDSDATAQADGGGSTGGGATGDGGSTGGGSTGDGSTGGGSTGGGSTGGGSTGGGGTGATGQVTLTWNPPTQKADGSQLTNLAGYKIYYGQNQSTLISTINVSTSGVTSYVVDGLSVGATYYFAMAAVDSVGLESQLSAIVSATIN